MKPFHLKYRASSFDDIIGNSHTVEGLKALVAEKKVTSYLLVGPRGCGKTTVARIMASELGVKAHNLYEFDLADVGIKEKGRELKDEAKYATLSGGAKCYLLDEIQEASSGFFGSILKLIEEPPRDTFFILCTTNLDKIPRTVRSRCSEWRLGVLNQAELMLLVDRVSSEEGIEVSQQVRRAIVRRCEGSPREALILLESIAGVADESVQLRIVNDSNEPDNDIRAICQALLNKKSWKETSSLVKAYSGDFEQARRMVLGYMAAVLMSSDNERAAEIIEFFKEPFFDSGRAGFVQASYYANKI